MWTIALAAAPSQSLLTAIPKKLLKYSLFRAQLFPLFRVSPSMNQSVRTVVLMGCAVFTAASTLAQQAPPAQPSTQPAPRAVAPDDNPVPLEWTPPALTALMAQAAVKNSFTLDRNLLSAAAGLVPDSDAPTRQAIQKLDGVSVHILRFGATGVPDEAAVNSIREAYHLRGWKH